MTANPTTDNPDGPGAPVIFDAVLTPHRSMSPRVARMLVLGFALISATAGVAFVANGMWPIAGYFGLDVLLVWFAFRASFRDARRFETVRLTPVTTTVRRVLPSRQERSWSLNTAWLKVEHDPDALPARPITLRSAGKSLSIGRFLTPGERGDLADALRAALARLRGPHLG